MRLLGLYLAPLDRDPPAAERHLTRLVSMPHATRSAMCVPFAPTTSIPQAGNDQLVVTMPLFRQGIGRRAAASSFYFPLKTSECSCGGSLLSDRRRADRHGWCRSGEERHPLQFVGESDAADPDLRAGERTQAGAP